MRLTVGSLCAAVQSLLRALASQRLVERPACEKASETSEPSHQRSPGGESASSSSKTGSPRGRRRAQTLELQLEFELKPSEVWLLLPADETEVKSADGVSSRSSSKGRPSGTSQLEGEMGGACGLCMRLGLKATCLTTSSNSQVSLELQHSCSRFASPATRVRVA
ncbi:MAG: hypothetical protein SGPRY_000183 [Prymnesium sp.]